MEPRLPAVYRLQLTNPPSALGIHPSFCLIFLVISFITFTLCCLLISSTSVDSSCLLCRRCRLYSLNKARILAQQSSHHFRILYFFASSYTPPFQRGASASLSLSFDVLDLVLVQKLPPPFFPQTSSSIDPSPLGSNLSMSSFILCLPPEDCSPFLSSFQ